MATSKRGTWATIRRIAASDRISGLIMLGFALAGLLLANLPFTAHAFEQLENFRIAIPHTNIDMGLGHWVQDGLLTVFFLTVGLELKQELTTGITVQSQSRGRADAVRGWRYACAAGTVHRRDLIVRGGRIRATRHRFRNVVLLRTDVQWLGGAHSHGYRVLIGRIGPVRQSVAGDPSALF